MHRFLPLLLLPIAGCSLGDSVALPEPVPAALPEPTPDPEPEPAALSSATGSSSVRLATLLLLVVPATGEREEYDLLYADGTRLVGFYDPTTGEFALTYDFPPTPDGEGGPGEAAPAAGQQPVQVDRLQQVGRRHTTPHDTRMAAGQQRPVLESGEYRETTTYTDGQQDVIDYGYAAFAEATELWGASPEGDTLQATLRSLPEGEESLERWERAGVYRLVSRELYAADGSYRVEYSYDDLATSASPDQEGDYAVAPDGSGAGHLAQAGEDGSFAVYDYRFGIDGSVSGTYTWDDPATLPEPDIEGEWTEDPLTGSTEQSYTLHYGDGTELLVHEVIAADGSIDQTYVWDDPDTPVAPDVEGRFHYLADGSGEGRVLLRGEHGQSTVCDYVLGPAGRVDTEVCREQGPPPRKDGA